MNSLSLKLFYLNIDKIKLESRQISQNRLFYQIFLQAFLTYLETASRTFFYKKYFDRLRDISLYNMFQLLKKDFHDKTFKWTSEYRDK